MRLPWQAVIYEGNRKMASQSYGSYETALKRGLRKLEGWNLMLTRHGQHPAYRLEVRKKR